MNVKEKVVKIKSKLSALYLAYKHKDTPIAAKVIICITLGYALSPIDLIPDFRHMKINNKSKVAMNIFHQAKRRIALIASLLGQFADVA